MQAVGGTAVSQALGERNGRRQPERLSKAARRHQLLDSAAQLITQRGIEAVTMEGVAALAEVSKALPYLHFTNAEALILALRQRELDMLTERVAAAAHRVVGFDAKIAAIVRTCFDVYAERGSLLMALVFAHDTSPTLQAQQSKVRLSKSDWFLAGLFEEEFKLRRRDAQVAQRILATGMVGAMEAWAEGIASRRSIERVAVRLIVDGTRCLAATADGDPHTRSR